MVGDELTVVFQAVAEGETQKWSRERSPHRHRNTVNRAYNVVLEFKTRDLSRLDDGTANEIATAAMYSTTAKYVRDLFLRWQTWSRVGQPAQAGIVRSNESLWGPQIDPHQDGLRRELERIAGKTSVGVYTTLVPTGDEMAGWHGNLREHTRSLGLPSLLDSHARVLATHQEVILAARQRLETRELKIISGLIAEVRFFDWAIFIFEELVSCASKGVPLWDPDFRIYRKSAPDAEDQREVLWGEHSLTYPCGSEHFDPIVAAHKKIRAVASRLYPKLAASAQNATDEAKKVSVEVLSLLRMPLIPGNCSECRPGRFLWETKVAVPRL